MSPRGFALAVSAAAALATPAAAAATTVTYDGDALVVSGVDNASHDLQFRLSADQAHDEILDTAGFTSIPGDCTFEVDPTWIRCPGRAAVRVALGSGNDALTFDGSNFDCFGAYDLSLGDGDNRLNLAGGCPAAPAAAVNVTSGSGSDVLTGGSQGPMTLFAGGGADSVYGGGAGDVVRGGEGADRLFGGGGDDQVLGEGGDDLVTGATGADLLDGGAGDDALGRCESCGITVNDTDGGADAYVGGPGLDTVWLDSHVGGMAISLDGQANDGSPGEGDNVGTDIEAVEGTKGGDVYRGRPEADVFFGNAGDDVIHGGGGNDEMRGDSGQDQLFGEGGDDRLFGSFGDDTVDGGPGVDSLFGDEANCSAFSCPSYNDTILARDGEVDSVQCGAGADRVTADANDVIAQDGFQACETVDRAAALLSQGPPPPPPPPPPCAGCGVAPSRAAVAAVGALRISKSLRLKVTCPGACRFRVSVLLGAKAAKRYRLGARVLTIGSASGTLTSAGTRTVTFKLSSRARQRLRRARSVAATLRLSTVTAGRTTVRNRTLTLKP